MTEDEAIERLKTIHSKFGGDPELMHVEEDALMLTVIASLGWVRFVAAHKDADVVRWFA